MTVPLRLAANRRNARLSTGPRTASGKRNVAVNALRHGLSVPVFADPVLAGEVAELAERIANGSTDPEVRERARDVAAAQIDVERVRHARHAVIARPAMGAPVSEARSDAMRETIRELWTLDRYERRAMSRRKSANRALQAALFRNLGSVRNNEVVKSRE
jgi:predicted outer membrane protein